MKLNHCAKFSLLPLTVDNFEQYKLLGCNKPYKCLKAFSGHSYTLSQLYLLFVLMQPTGCDSSSSDVAINTISHALSNLQVAVLLYIDQQCWVKSYLRWFQIKITIHIYHQLLAYTINYVITKLKATYVPSVLWRCWLGGRKGIRPVKTEWSGAGVVICLQRGADLHKPSWCHCHSLFLASVKSRLVLPFWYRPTRVVLEIGPLNGCVCVCVKLIAT